MADSLFTRFQAFLCRNRLAWERLEARRFAAPWRRDRLPSPCGPGRA